MNKIPSYIYCVILLPLFLFSTAAVAENQSQRYLITAATSGLGVAISETLASQGHALILAGRDAKKLSALKLKLEKSYRGQYTVELFDYSDPVSIQNLGLRLKKTAINGIAIIPPRVTINTTDIPSSEDWLNMFKFGFTAPLEVLKETLANLQPKSSIVVISGLSSVHYLLNYKNVNVLRKMWIAEVKNLGYQLGDRKIRANSISPGVILTDSQKNKIQKRALEAHKSFEEQLKEEAKDTPLHQYGNPEDVAEATAFLLSDRSKHINGVNLVMDGGLSKTY